MVETTERTSPHSRIDPASADHIPVMEYSRGVTELLFSATNASAKSWVTSACSMAPTARRAPTSMTGASSLPSPGDRARAVVAAPRRVTSPTRSTIAPAMLATKASQTPIVPRWASTISRPVRSA